jgi:uncharacterized LabA/DUF88 family protein
MLLGAIPFTEPKGRRMATYLFIDGAYLRCRLRDIAKNFSIDPLDFNYGDFRASIAQKAFYYDCLPARGRREKSDDYDKRVQPEQSLFKAIKSLPGYHVVLGEAVRSGGEIVQKGVDILIAVDMLTHSFRGVIDRAVLFAGDHDFTPLVSALVQQGIYITVGYHPASIAEELLDAADERIEYDTCKLWYLTTPQFQRRFPAPQVGEMGDQALSDPSARVLKTGMFETEEARLYKDGGICRLYLPYIDVSGNKRYRYIFHQDETVIMSLLVEKKVVVCWK